MQNKLKRYYIKIKKKLSSKKFLFNLAAFLMTVLLIVFAVYNFVFLINKIESAYNPQLDTSNPTTQFNIEEFKKLNLTD